VVCPPLNLKDAAFTSIAQRWFIAGCGQTADGFHEDDLPLGKCLTQLSACHPVDVMTGERSQAPVTLDEYRAMVAPGALSPTARMLCDRLSIDPAAWRTASGEGGIFHGVAVGARAARVAFAATQGKQTIADKTGIWRGL
jgi:hypothetical protein